MSAALRVAGCPAALSMLALERTPSDFVRHLPKPNSRYALIHRLVECIESALQPSGRSQLCPTSRYATTLSSVAGATQREPGAKFGSRTFKRELEHISDIGLGRTGVEEVSEQTNACSNNNPLCAAATVVLFRFLEHLLYRFFEFDFHLEVGPGPVVKLRNIVANLRPQISRRPDQPIGP